MSDKMDPHTSFLSNKIQLLNDSNLGIKDDLMERDSSTCSANSAY